MIDLTSQAPSSRAFGITALRALRKQEKEQERKLPLGRQILLQFICLLIGLTVLFPIVWIFSVSLSPVNLSKPLNLQLIPDGATFDAYAKVLAKPTSNNITFIQLTINSLKVAFSTSIVSSSSESEDGTG